ncbi:MAG TPA: hypothetical protein GXZ30_06825 [Propionibacterium sp.]|jgi:hypothetical protein|nr:hypothetical protein [Propionibacterium sp.]
MIAAGFLPHPPLLLGEYASLADPAADLRDRCRTVARELVALAPDGLVVLTGVPRVPPVIDSRPPLGLRVARELLAGLGPGVDVAVVDTLTVPFDADADEIRDCAMHLRETGAGARGVLVMGDGSARRSEKAPGHLDERAFAVDQQVAEALARGVPEELAELDPELAAELMIAGRAAWQVLAAAAPGRPDRATAEALDPFGVLYHVALWSWPGHD